MLDVVNGTISRIGVLLRAVVAWLLVALVVVQTIIVEIGPDIPAVAQYGGQAVALIIGLIAVVRRVTPVPKESRGILPADG